ncbi:LysR family transcriptional regulator [Vibrio sp. LaRot3]|uniref:LysR family transcriptional regulator n=1 Tax=Vibrio sp. LaRot3 TaxID=2998829 RepID=UPI0022CE2AD0|nr:LysR family transcriptional regulator [Vibrio sp. LaRot3]MDA0149840.1 LysR family transcriptional regulator [Vibrio sp. LaRot3]
MNSIFGNVDDLYLFCAVVEAGSLQSASNHLKLPVSTMSRRLSALEDRLNIRLLEKQGRELVATETGQNVFEQFKSGMESIETAFKQLSEDSQEVVGKIKLALPHNFYRSFVRQVVEEFLQAYPKVRLELILSQEQMIPQTDRDLLMTFDVTDMQGMIARPLFTAQHGFYASPEYIASHGPMTKIEDLKRQDWVSVDHINEMTVYQQDDLVEAIAIKPKLVVNDILAVVDAVEKGLGIASLPHKHISQDSKLVQILPEYHRSARQAYLVYRERKYQPKALRLLIEALLAGVASMAS